MKIGYPCINNSVNCTSNSTFRLKSYNEDILKEKIKNNLNCLFNILKFNKENQLLFFRISSDLIPFASHPINKFNWEKQFNKELSEIGDYIRGNNFRISMHPDQFVLLNSPNPEILKRSILELEYHCKILDLMGLNDTAKVQIHVGGVYGNKEEATLRFIENYNKLPEIIKQRLCIENDERLFNLKDCLLINKKTNIPVIFDFFHHFCYNSGEDLKEAIKLSSQTWKEKDGILMTDYSSQEKDSRIGKHIESINLKDFKRNIDGVKEFDFDVMLEIKDKEKSAIKARDLLREMKLIL